MASLDAETLFANILIDETIKNAVDNLLLTICNEGNVWVVLYFMSLGKDLAW